VPDGGLIEMRDHTGAVLLPLTHTPLYAESEDVVPAPHTVTVHGRAVRILHSTFADRGELYATIVGTSLENVDETMRELRNLTIATIPVVLLIAGLGGYWLSRKALSPVDEITQVARSISEQNLSARLPVPRTGDELERMSQAWNDVLDRLESALERIRRFTADASHELRTPIALIRGSAELSLRRDRDPQEYRKTLSEIQTHAERMTELTDSLLTLARADAIGLSMPLETEDLARLVRQTVQEATPLAVERRIQLQTHVPATSISAPVNLAGIRRLLLILIDNALKFTPPDGQVTVSVSEDSGGVVLAVSDSGPGMEPAVLSQIFERFYRADTARGSSGTGLGLPIAKLIAQAHAASIEVDSVPGHGSTFQVHLKTQTTGLV
ncbi:MAG: ATP-binding protein, partial [Acidobacteriota bacterium]